jgi:carbon monoxide dehydrogenase subunit G
MMDIVGEFTFNLPQEKVWDVLRDPRVLAVIIPICRDMKQTGDDTYGGSLFFKAGSVAGMFKGTIHLLNIQAPDSYDIKVQGTSPVGVVNISGDMSLEAQNDQTLMRYQGDIQFGGRIASVGSRMIDTAVRSMMQQSFETLNVYLMTQNK